MRSVVKHKYINGGKKGKAQARAHLNYIEHRDGPDRVQGGRPFFDRDQDETDPSGFKKSIEDSKQRNVLMHKLILSPGINGIDLKEYTREIMTELEDHKGMELDWQAVIHSNTDHEHVHLVIMGKSQKGKVLSIKRSDHDVIRAVGDRYLERKHEFDRYCNKTVDHILRDETQNKNIDLDKLMKPFSLELEEKEKERSGKKRASSRGKKEKKQEKSLYEDSQAQLPTRRKPRRQRLMENRGRNDFFHDLYASNTNKARLEKLREARPELGQDIDKQLESQKGHDAERRANIEKQVYQLDRILGIKTAKKRDRKKEPEKDQKKGPDRNEIDLRKVDAKDKIHLKNGDVISKYDNLDYLSSVNQQLKEGPAGNRLSRADYARMSSWMKTKKERGDDAYGEAPKLSPKEKELQHLQELARGLNENLKGLDPEKDRAQIQKLKSDYFDRMFNKDSSYRKLAPAERFKDTQKSEFRYREASHLKEKITKGDPKGKEQTKARILEHFKRNRSRQKLVKPERTSVLGKDVGKKSFTREDIDYSKIPGEDKITLASGEIISKYDSLDYLKSTDKELRKGPRKDRLEKSDYSKMWQWIGTKETMGEKHYGNPPFIEKEKENRENTDFESIADKDKIMLASGEIISKYDSLDYLKSTDNELRKGPRKDRLEKSDYSKMWQWIGTKETMGEKHYGEPPRINEPTRENDPEILAKQDLDEKQEIDRINNLAYEMTYKMDQLDPDKDHEKIAELKAQYMKEIEEPGSTEHAALPQKEGELSAEEKDAIESQRVRELIYQLHYRSRELDPEMDSKKLRDLNQEYLQEVANPNSTSFAPIANQEPSVEEREYAEALEKEKMEDQRLEALATELSVSLLELDIANDGNTIWNKIEQAIKEVDNPESAIESEAWEQQKQAELERLSNLLERHADLSSPMDKEQDLSSDRQDQENTNFWEELLSDDQPQDGKEREKDKDLEKSAAENQDRQDELNPDESPAEKLLDFEKIFEQFKEMLEQHMKEEAERQRKEEEEREKQEKEEREREQGVERDEG